MLKYILLFLIGYSAFSLSAQEDGEKERLRRYFATQQANARLDRDYAGHREKQREWDKFIRKHYQFGRVKEKSIPVVFHILYTNEEEKISTEQIQSQLSALNRDFSHESIHEEHPADRPEGFYKRRPDHLAISFCLGMTKEQGQDLEGIEYVKTEREDWAFESAIKNSQAGGSSPWDTDRYLNIWVAHLADTVSGYAQYPGGPKELDGIVIDYRFLGTIGTAQAPFNEGKTLTHLVGNYLGLHDLWNESVRCGDDQVSDTPVHNAPNHGCPVYRHVSTCGNDFVVEMTMNFMDNTDDACMYMFTFGQMMRMHAVLSARGPRKHLGAGNSRCTFTPSSFNLSSSESGLQPNLENAAGDDLQLDFFLQPNPARSQVLVRLNQVLAQQGNLQIMDSNGRVVGNHYYLLPAQQNEININCQNLSPGFYLVKLLAGKTLITKRLIIAE